MHNVSGGYVYVIGVGWGCCCKAGVGGCRMAVGVVEGDWICVVVVCGESWGCSGGGVG